MGFNSGFKGLRKAQLYVTTCHILGKSLYNLFLILFRP